MATDKEYNYSYRAWLLKLGLIETRYIIFDNVLYPEYFDDGDSVLHYDGKI